MVIRIPLLGHEIVVCGNGLDMVKSDLQALSRYSSVHVLVDSNTAIHCLPLLSGQMTIEDKNVHLVDAGESSKSFTTVERVIDSLYRAGADRSSVLVAVGGGMVSDLGGVVAGIYMRGIPHILIPTSLMAMVDASIGGKCAINCSGVKNLAGVFKEPETVIVSGIFLRTLPERELRSGFAEVIKHSILDNRLFSEPTASLYLSNSLERNRLIESSIRFKCRVVSSDFEDTGVRRQLNFGHTVGHVIESISQESDEQPLLHGEAVALGMMVESVLSHSLNGFPYERLLGLLRMIRSHFDALALPVFSEDWNRLIAGDKKNVSGASKFVLLGKDGDVSCDVPVSTMQLQEAVGHLHRIVSEKLV